MAEPAELPSTIAATLVVFDPDRDHPDVIEDARLLISEYAGTLPYSLCFQGLDQEIAGLPGGYAPPGGRLILAYISGDPAASIAFRPLPAAAGGGPASLGACCEMKRLYVRPQFRGRRLGRILCERLINEARVAGYARMRLDSDEREMVAATRIYDSLGFVRIPPYNSDPIPGTIWMEKVL